MRKTVRIGAFAALAVLGFGLSACQSSQQAADDALYADDTELPDEGLVKGLMEGLGVLPPRKQGVRYDLRAPLVVPRDTAALPVPQNPRAFEGMQSWPVDQDIAEARRLRALAAGSGNGTNNNISPQEVAAMRAALDAGGDTSDARMREIAAARKLSPDQQLALFKAAQNHEFYDYNGQPIRYTLQNPPSVYLQPADGAPVTTEDPEYIKAAKRKSSLFGGFFNW